MKLIANHTIHGAYSEPVLDAKGAPVKDSRGREKRRHIESAIVPPETEFDAEELGLDDKEVESLLRAGAVRRKTKVVDDDSEPHDPPAPNTAPPGPASGATRAPDPNAVAKAAAGKS